MKTTECSGILRNRPIQDLSLQVKLLIVNFDNLGDVVFSSYIAEVLSREFPKANIDVLCSTYAHQVAQCYPGVHEVHHLVPPWRSTFEHHKGKLLEFVKVLYRLRCTRYDTMFCASPHWKDVLVARLVRAGSYVGFVKRPFVKHLLTHPCSYPCDDEPILLAMQRLVLKAFPDASFKQLRYRLVPRRTNPRRKKKLVALHPFSGDIRKTWPMENWLQLAERLRDDYLLYWIGSKLELEKLSDIDKLPKREIYFSQKTFSISDLIELLLKVTLFIGHDSGPSHLACALGGSGVTIYPEFTSKKYFPQGIGSFQMLVGNPITLITVDEVYSTVIKRLSMEES